MKPNTLGAALLGTTLAATGATAQDVTLTIESWRNDDLAIWQDQIIPAFEADNPGIKLRFTRCSIQSWTRVLPAT
jgi:raffinose/stachyose/melibiose transport system substrate-binding protein